MKVWVVETYGVCDADIFKTKEIAVKYCKEFYSNEKIYGDICFQWTDDGENCDVGRTIDLAVSDDIGDFEVLSVIRKKIVRE